jgi:hypothetical protein
MTVINYSHHAKQPSVKFLSLIAEKKTIGLFQKTSPPPKVRRLGQIITLKAQSERADPFATSKLGKNASESFLLLLKPHEAIYFTWGANAKMRSVDEN